MSSTRPHFAFLHGGGQGSWVWAETIAALAAQDAPQGSASFALDVPGCGRKRNRVTTDITPRDVTMELIADIERSGARDVTLIGHSLAGNLLPMMAGMRPDLFRRLVYLSCSVPLPGQTVLEMMGNSRHGENEHEVGWPVDPGTTAMRDRYAEMYCNDMTRATADRFLGSLNRDDWPASFFTNTAFDFGPSGVPATYVVCVEDRILPAAWQLIFAARFRAARVLRLDAGHQAMITRPHAFAEILRQEANLGLCAATQEH